MDGNLGYIVAAYALVWGVLGAYLLRRWRRLAELERYAGGGRGG